MLSMRLTCILALAGVFGFGVASVACTQQAAATPSGHGDDDDDSSGDDDDDTTTSPDGGGSSSSSGGSSSSSSSGAPVDSGPPPKSTMTFFITSTPASADGSGNLGGLTGADKKCQDLATAVQAGDHKWAAFLGVKGTNPKDRIGKGPWKNQKGDVVATDIPSLLDATLHPLGDSVFMDEKGAVIPDTGQYILTGSLGDGTATQNNCNDWTSNQNNANARFGLVFPSRNPVAGANWAFANKNPVNNNNSNCTPGGIKGAKSEARIACFATD